MKTNLIHLPQGSISERAYLRYTQYGQTQWRELQNIFILGRHFDCDLELEDKYVSHRHARIERKKDQFQITDLRSRNGTFLNGSSVLQAVLNHGDRIRVGESEFVFQINDTNETQATLLSSKNQKWNKQLQNINNMARSEFPVLVTGPSGTGKELLARAIHDNSTRKHGPFVSVNCSALSKDLVESELFGHLQGSYTGASKDRKGAFECARNGTLFLDEIGDLPIDLQPKLLRALENCEVKPVGSDKTVPTDVRIVAATHNTLKDKVQKGEFREDLYFRLHVLNLSPPPLNQRVEDFETLIYQFAKQYRVRFSFEAISELKKQAWPGNIRELKNLVSRASVIYPNLEVSAEQALGLLDKIPNSNPLKIMTNDSERVRAIKDFKSMEKTLICEHLVRCGGNQRKTSESLGMPKSTLNDRIKTYQINIDELIRQSQL